MHLASSECINWFKFLHLALERKVWEQVSPGVAFLFHLRKKSLKLDAILATQNSVRTVYFQNYLLLSLNVALKCNIKTLAVVGPKFYYLILKLADQVWAFGVCGNTSTSIKLNNNKLRSCCLQIIIYIKRTGTLAEQIVIKTL